MVKRTGVVVGIALACFALAATLAAGPATAREAEAPEYQPRVYRVSQMAGMPAETRDGEELGKLAGVAIAGSHVVRYVVLSADEEGKGYAVPWSAVEIKSQSGSTGSDGDRIRRGALQPDRPGMPKMEKMVAVLDITQDEVAEASGFDVKGEWPAGPERMWRGRGRTWPPGMSEGRRTGGRGREAGRRGEGRQGGPSVMKASDLMGMEAYLRDEKLGKLVDVIIDSREGALVYATIGLEDSGDQGGKMVTVPWRSANLDAEAKKIIVQGAGKDALMALAYGKDSQPDLGGRKYAEDLHMRFGITPYWVAWGYEGAVVPPADVLDD